MVKTMNRSSCPICCSLDLFGDKWSLLIIRDMVFMDKRYYGEFLTSDEGISTNILADRLKQMEDKGLVLKYPDPDDGKKYVYLLTVKGQELVPLLLEMIRWGIKYDKSAASSNVIRRKLKNDMPGMIAELTLKIEQSRKQFLATLDN